MAAAKERVLAKKKQLECQPLLFKPEWNPPRIDDLPDWSGAKRICIDVETKDEGLANDLGPGVRFPGSYVTSYQFAIEDGPAFFLPVQFQGGDNLDREKVESYLREQCSKFTGTIVGANLPYDLDYMQEREIVFPKVKWFRDIQLAGPILNEYERSYSLEALANKYELPGKDDTELKEACRAHGIRVVKKSRKWMNHIWKLPARYVQEYGIQDVRLPLQILRKQERQIDAEDLWNIYDLESRVLPVVLAMRRHGVRIDIDKLNHIEDFTVKEEKLSLRQLEHDTGVKVDFGDVWRAEPLSEALSRVGITCPKTINPKTDKEEISVDADFLKGCKNSVADHILRARQMNKARTTFVHMIRSHLVGDRIHCTFNQLRKTKSDGSSVGTITGRFSSADPNMQQQPSKRGVLGNLWREIYVPDVGCEWASCDYSQQEFRLVVHFAARAIVKGKHLKGALEAAQAYIDDPDVDAHQAVADMVGISRTKAKTINFSIIYGAGGAKVCSQLDLPTKFVMSKRLKKMIEVAGDEGEALLKNFNSKASYLKAMSELASSQAEKNGYVRTLLGRKCRFPIGNDRRRMFTWKALNKLIQGSAADQTKLATIKCFEAGLCPQLQIHDELDKSIKNRDEAEEIAHIMRTCAPLTIPVKVDIEIGPSWGEAR